MTTPGTMTAKTTEETDGPLLSLCVPTYKRPALLRESLRAILSQITPDMAAQVEVSVFDNASPDDTPAAVAGVQREFPDAPCRYVRHAENIGPDANFYGAVRQARGRFVLLVSDDDVLLPGAVATLLGLIRTHPDFDAFGLNVRLFKDSPLEETASPAFTFPEDRIVRDRDQALLLLQAHFGFLSCIAFRRESVVRHDYTDKVGTIIIQSFFFLDALAPGRGLYVTSRVYIAQRADNVGGFNFFQVIVTNYHQLMQYALTVGYAPPTVRRVLDQHLHFIHHCVVTFKSKGIGTLRPRYGDGAVRLLRAYGPTPFLLFTLIPRMLTPRGVYALLKRLNLWAGALRGRHAPPAPEGNT